MGKKIRILFLIHDLGQGGAEKVLVNLVNNMDRTKFDISLTVLFGGGINEQFLKDDIKFYTIFPREVPGNSKLMKLLTPRQLHALCVKTNYDIEVAYLEGPSSRVISGCTNQETKLVAWIHSTLKNKKEVSSSFRSYRECYKCYKKFDRIVCVSEDIRKRISDIFDYKWPLAVIHNPINSNEIREKASEDIERDLYRTNEINLIAVGTLKNVKGYDRLLRIIHRLYLEKYPIHLFILGVGPMRVEMEQFIKVNRLTSCITFLGYQTNPYKYVARSDLYVCASYSEGFSTSVVEALIVGTPICTVEVSGMREILCDNKYGLLTKNDEESLYNGIKSLLDDPPSLLHYKNQAKRRGNDFSLEETLSSVEKTFLDM